MSETAEDISTGSNQPILSRENIAWALKTSIPVLMGYIPLGIVFGFLFVQAGAKWWMAPLASILIYGGAAQYMMVPMLAGGLSVATIAFATAVINLRHIFYGLPILHKFPTTPFKKWATVFWLTDETFSQISTLPKGTPENKIFLLAFFNWCWWITGSTIGSVIGANAQINLAGIDFVLTSLFAMLMCEQWRGRVTAWPLWTALGAYALARWINPENSLAISIGFCMFAGILWGRSRKVKEPTELKGE